MLADMAMKLEAARQMVYVAAAKSERGDADLPFFGAAAKCFASDVAMEVTTDAVQLLGGAGYVKDFPVERMMRDAKITQIYEGTNQIQRLVMARQSPQVGRRLALSQVRGTILPCADTGVLRCASMPGAMISAPSGTLRSGMCDTCVTR